MNNFIPVIAGAVIVLVTAGGMQWYPNNSIHYNDITVHKGMAFIAADHGLDVINVSRPGTPHLAARFFSPHGGTGRIHIQDYLAVLQCTDQGRLDYSEKLLVLDVSRPHRPRMISVFQTPKEWIDNIIVIDDDFIGSGLIRSVRIHAGRIYGLLAIPNSHSRLVSFEVTENGKMSIDRSCNIDPNAIDFHIQGHRAAIACGWKGLQIVTIGATGELNPQAPIQYGGFCCEPWIENDTVYCADEALGGTAFHLENNTPPVRISLGDGKPNPRLVSMNRIRKAGDRFFFSGITDTGWTLSITSFSPPSGFLVKSSITSRKLFGNESGPVTEREPIGMAIDGNRLFLTHRQQGLLIFEVSSADQLSLLGRFQPRSNQ